MPTVSDKLNEADEILRRHDVVDPRREASSLLALALGCDRAFLITHPEYSLARAEEELVDEYVRRRARREPFQYISRTQEFYGLDFEVTPDVLIPRPETEMVVDRSLEHLYDGATLCEVGVGSGCISVSALVNRPGVTAVGLDVSAAAINVARRNAERHRVAERLELIESDVYAALDENAGFDMIVSNPPYVPTEDLPGLQAEVRDFEPEVALIGGEDGLAVIERIIVGAPRFLRPRGYLLLEIGFDQSAMVAAMFDPSIWHPPELLPDLQGIPRLVSTRRI